jgi:hypothetical protein
MVVVVVVGSNPGPPTCSTRATPSLKGALDTVCLMVGVVAGQEGTCRWGGIGMTIRYF